MCTTCFKYPSWLERYGGAHPAQVVHMMDDIRSGRLDVELRPTDDVEELLGLLVVSVGRGCLKTADYVDRVSGSREAPTLKRPQVRGCADGEGE